MSAIFSRTDYRTVGDGAASPVGEFDVSRFSPASPLSILIPAQRDTLIRLNELFASGNVLITDVVEEILSDPAVVIELFARANQPIGRSPSPNLTQVKSLVFRLGVQEILRTVSQLESRGRDLSPRIEDELATIRSYGLRVAAVASIIAHATYREHLEAARTLGVLSCIGDLLACLKFRDVYAELVQHLSRPALVYRLAHDYHFDTRLVLVNYLKSRNVPQSLLYVFDRDIPCKTPVQAALRFIIDGAAELVDCFDAARFERYAPEKELPGKSALRLLRLNPRQRESIYEEVLAHLGALQGTLKPLAQSEKVVETSERVTRVDSDVLLPADLGEIEYLEVGETEERPEGLIPFSDEAKRFVAELHGTLKSTRKAELLLSRLLRILVDDGPFERAALLVLQEGRKLAVVHTVAGGLEGHSKNVAVDDPISPLALGSTKIRSFNSTLVVDFHAPFGVSAYALAPLEVKDAPPVVLYVDCGAHRCLPFEGRKLFRLTVGLVNRALNTGAKVETVDITAVATARF